MIDETDVDQDESWIAICIKLAVLLIAIVLLALACPWLVVAGEWFSKYAGMYGNWVFQFSP